MEIFLNILLLIYGLVLLIGGANFFVNGSSAIAKRFKVPSIIIGLTIVAIGTSLPELAISVTSAIKGSVDMSVGNIVGSNLFNMLIIIGITACMSPIIVQKSSKKFDFPFMIIVTLFLLLFSCNSMLENSDTNSINRIESLFLLILFGFYIYFNVRIAKKEKSFVEMYEEYKTDKIQNTDKTQNNEEKKDLKFWVIIIYIVVGLASVVVGGDCVSSSAQLLASKAGMSEGLIGLTIVAFGTSLPELATAIVAARKGENDLALGNILGSNILNILLIIGSVGVISTVTVSSTMLVDLALLFVFTLIFSFLALRKSKIGRKEGIILILMYLTYLTFAIVRNYCF